MEPPKKVVWSSQFYRNFDSLVVQLISHRGELSFFQHHNGFRQKEQRKTTRFVSNQHSLDDSTSNVAIREERHGG